MQSRVYTRVMTNITTASIRVVAATNPVTGEAVTRQSKTKHYTHALVVHWNAIPAHTVPAGTYTHPAKRIRGRNIPAYTSTLSRDSVAQAQEAGASVISFHEGREAADKAGRAYVSKCASSLAESRSVFGDLVPNIPMASRYQIVEVEQV